MVHRALVDAVAWKYIAENPASRVKPPKRGSARCQVWSVDEIQTFLTHVRRDRFAALFLLELTTGIRRGQVCGLRWDSVDLETGEITV
jgi:integrase